MRAQQVGAEAVGKRPPFFLPWLLFLVTSVAVPPDVTGSARKEPRRESTVLPGKADGPSRVPLPRWRHRWWMTSKAGRREEAGFNSGMLQTQLCLCVADVNRWLLVAGTCLSHVGSVVHLFRTGSVRLDLGNWAETGTEKALMVTGLTVQRHGTQGEPRHGGRDPAGAAQAVQGPQGSRGEDGPAHVHTAWPIRGSPGPQSLWREEWGHGRCGHDGV